MEMSKIKKDPSWVLQSLDLYDHHTRKCVTCLKKLDILKEEQRAVNTGGLNYHEKRYVLA